LLFKTEDNLNIINQELKQWDNFQIKIDQTLARQPIVNDHIKSEPNSLTKTQPKNKWNIELDIQADGYTNINKINKENNCIAAGN